MSQKEMAFLIKRPDEMFRFYLTYNDWGFFILSYEMFLDEPCCLWIFNVTADDLK